MSLTKAEQAAVKRDGDRCRRCGRSLVGVYGSKHHRQAKGMGGGSKARYDRVENVVCLCGTGVQGCHGWAHAHPEAAQARGWIVSRYANPAEQPVWPLDGSCVFLNTDGTVTVSQPEDVIAPYWGGAA